MVDHLASILHSFLMGPQFYPNIHHIPWEGDPTLSSRSRHWLAHQYAVFYIDGCWFKGGHMTRADPMRWQEGLIVLASGCHFSTSGTSYGQGNWESWWPLAAILREIRHEMKLTLSNLMASPSHWACGAGARLPLDFVTGHSGWSDLEFSCYLQPKALSAYSSSSFKFQHPQKWHHFHVFIS